MIFDEEIVSAAYLGHYLFFIKANKNKEVKTGDWKTIQI
jgi:hypothetical protein